MNLAGWFNIQRDFLKYLIDCQKICFLNGEFALDSQERPLSARNDEILNNISTQIPYIRSQQLCA